MAEPNTEVSAPVEPQVSNTAAERRGYKKWLAAAGGAALIVASSFALVECDEDSQPARTEAAAADADPTVTTPEVCEDTWEMPGVDHGDRNRWFAEGITDIKDAETEDDARKALDVWLNGNMDRDDLAPQAKHPGVKSDSKLFAAAYNAMKASIFSNNDLPDLKAADLEVTKAGKVCASETAVAAVATMEAELALARVEVGEAPADGLNTGTDENGDVTVAEEAGVSGDRKALVIVKIGADGKKCTVAIMGRCGQLVVEEDCAPDLPKGPTDETPKTPVTTTTTTPGTTTSIVPNKVPVPLPGPHTQPGAGGSPEHGMDPQNDSDEDGYGPGDKEQPDTDPDGDGIHNVIDSCDTQAENRNGYQDDDGCPDTAPTTTTAPSSTPTTGKPREEAPPTPPTTEVEPDRDETPPTPDN